MAMPTLANIFACQGSEKGVLYETPPRGIPNVTLINRYCHSMPIVPPERGLVLKLESDGTAITWRTDILPLKFGLDHQYVVDRCGSCNDRPQQ